MIETETGRSFVLIQENPQEYTLTKQAVDKCLQHATICLKISMYLNVCVTWIELCHPQVHMKS